MSALRRTCNLTLVARDININNYYWGLNTKFKLEVGVKNIVDNKYPDIIWFPQGIYILTTFNTSVSTNNYTISLSGKDKMCLLNGDVGGSLTASIDFGVEEYVDLENDTITYTDIPIKKIIREAVHVWGNEPYHNIIINDIDDYGYELLEYRGSEETPMFLLKHLKSDIYINMTMNSNQRCYLKSEKYYDIPTIISQLENYDTRTDVDGVIPGTKFSLVLQKENENGIVNNVEVYTCAKITYGETAGYRLTDLTYAGELISSIGESLTSILDKIKNMLGVFEYFYDLDGRFIFQKKKTYVQNNWNNMVYREDDMYVESAAYTSAITYTFYDSNYFTSISHNPQLNNLKNDFSIWGVRKGITGEDLPIHMRYALDRKPTKYYSIPISRQESQNLIDIEKWPFTFDEEDWDENSETKANAIIRQKQEKYFKEQTLYEASNTLDWRELIYRMSLDYFQYNQLDDFISRVATANSEHYPTGYTGYEQYYTDMQGFWRQLYNPEYKLAEEPFKGTQYYTKKADGSYSKEEFDLITDVIPRDTTINYFDVHGNFYIFDEQQGFDREKEYYIKQDDDYVFYNIFKFSDNISYYYRKNDEDYDSKTFWHWNVTENPSALDFWFDFLGEGSELDKYMIPSIGDRVKAVNDDAVTGIYFKEIPDVLFITQEQYEALADKPMKTGYTYIRINSSLNNFFNISAQGKSAQDVMEELLYENTYCIESVSINSIPIFYLDANIRIGIKDERSNINGEYIVSKVTLPLTYNGTMSLSATRAADTIY